MHDILIVGISTVDAIAKPVDGFPGPGGLRFFRQLTFATGGNAVNCSLALAKLGIPCAAITRIGCDLLGDFILSELKRHEVEHAGVVRDPAVSTAFTFAAVSSDGERRFLHIVGTNATLCGADVPDTRLAGRRFVFVTGTMLMDSFDGEPTARVLAAAQAAGATTLLDTVFVETVEREEWRRRVWPALPHLDFFVPSQAEARALCGLDDPAQAAHCFQRAGARNVIIKLGADGVFSRSAQGHELHVPGFEVEVVDTTGAGDCWCAGLLVGLRENLPLEESLRLGNAVAAHGIQAAGASTAIQPLATVRAFMRQAHIAQ